MSNFIAAFRSFREINKKCQLYAKQSFEDGNYYILGSEFAEKQFSELHKQGNFRKAEYLFDTYSDADSNGTMTLQLGQAIEAAMDYVNSKLGYLVLDRDYSCEELSDIFSNGLNVDYESSKLFIFSELDKVVAIIKNDDYGKSGILFRLRASHKMKKDYLDTIYDGTSYIIPDDDLIGYVKNVDDKRDYFDKSIYLKQKIKHI